jgi:uncharacterized protein YggE
MPPLPASPADLSPESGYTGGTDDSEDPASGGGGVTIEAGRNEIGVAVTVVYELVP